MSVRKVLPSEEEIREKLLEVKDEWYKKKVDFDNEINQKRQKISRKNQQ